jgi:ribosomal protein S18 acetylase RimI-like enzyme
MGEKALELSLRYLSHEDESGSTIASILHLSNSIFNPESDSHRTSLEEWKTRLSDPASSIIYLVLQPSDDPGKFPHRPAPAVAFIFAYPRSHPEPLRNGSLHSLHIWLAGVSEEYRGRGCLDTMVNALFELERKRRGPGASSMPTFTVCTSPSKFPSMWAWVRARARWVLEKEWDGGKVMFSLTEW